MSLSRIIELAGVRTAIAGASQSRTMMIFLHGNGMRHTDLVPFAGSLALPMAFLFPRGPVPTASQGNAWWPVDEAAKTTALQKGPRDLFDRQPAGLTTAHELLGGFIAAVDAEFHPQRIVLGGFSQGGMLACDWALRASRPIDALVLLSTSRIDFQHWETCRKPTLSLPVFLSHGYQDADIAFSAGECLRDFLCSVGAAVDWLPFEGGHEIPLVVWSRLRRFLGQVPTASPLG